MQDKELLTELVRMILPDVEFDDLEITAQKSIEIRKDIHGVRFDIYVKSNDETVFEIEMQVLNQGNKYTFTNRCHEVDNLELGDGTTKIVLNAVGTADDVHGSLKKFLDYVAGKPSDDEYVKKLEAAVYKARQNKEWRREYMTLIMRDLENQEIGIEKEQRRQIEKLMKKGKTAEEIVDFCDYPIELVESVQESLLVTQ